MMTHIVVESPAPERKVLKEIVARLARSNVHVGEVLRIEKWDFETTFVVVMETLPDSLRVFPWGSTRPPILSVLAEA